MLDADDRPRTSLGAGGRAVLATLLLVSALALANVTFERIATIDRGAVRADQGHAFVVALPDAVAWPLIVWSDRDGNGRSALRMHEDGRALGPAHAAHDAVRAQGAGRYSHWGNEVWFSTPDNADPRALDRTYTLTIPVSLHPSLALVAAVLGLSALAWALRSSGGPGPARQRAATILAAVPAVFVALVLAGPVGPVAVGVARAKDAALAMAVSWHALLGVAIALFLLLTGAAVVAIAFRRAAMTLPHALALGLPAGMIVVAAIVVVALSSAAAGAVLAAVVLAGTWRVLSRLRPAADWRSRVIRTWPPVVLAAIAFGIWNGVLWHGPTDTLTGYPTGDLIYYASSLVAIEANRLDPAFLGSEGERMLPFNMLWPAIGAALRGFLPVEAFTFIAAAGPAAFITLTALVTGAAVATCQPVPGLTDRLLVGLAMIAAARYPYWIVESSPVIFSTALAVALACWLAPTPGRKAHAMIAMPLCLAAAVLSKVVTGLVLCIPPAFAITADALRASGRSAWLRSFALGMLLLAALVAAFLVVRFGPLFLAIGGFGPESLDMATRHPGRPDLWLPFAARDAGALLLLLLALWHLPARFSIAIAAGVAGFLLMPFLLRGTIIPVVVLATLWLIGSPAGRRSRALLAASLAGCACGVLLSDPGGFASGIAWAVCLGLAMFSVLDFPRSGAVPGGHPSRPVAAVPMFGRPLHLAATTVLLAVVAIAGGRILAGTDFSLHAQPIRPEDLRVWHAVRDHTEPGALVFTDQTGASAGVLEGWNTLAFQGQRQLYLSTWVQSGQLRGDVPRRVERLATNEKVLSGDLAPDAVPLSRTYPAYYAVVRRDHLPARPGWRVERVVDGFAIARWQPEGRT